MFVGRVFSCFNQKTISVRVDYVYKSKKYKMAIRKSSRFLVHDEAEEARKGDFVQIQVCRPRSKRKSMQLKKILHRAPQLYPETRKIIAERKSEGTLTPPFPLGEAPVVKPRKTMSLKERKEYRKLRRGQRLAELREEQEESRMQGLRDRQKHSAAARTVSMPDLDSRSFSTMTPYSLKNGTAPRFPVPHVVSTPINTTPEPTTTAVSTLTAALESWGIKCW